MSFLTKVAKKHKGKVEKVAQRGFGGKVSTIDDYRDAWCGNISKAIARNKMLLSVLEKNEMVSKITNEGARVDEAYNELDKVSGKASDDVKQLCKWNKAGGCFVMRLKKTGITINFGKDMPIYSLEGMNPEDGLKEAVSVMESIVVGMEKGEMDQELMDWMLAKQSVADKAKARAKKHKGN